VTRVTREVRVARVMLAALLVTLAARQVRADDGEMLAGDPPAPDVSPPLDAPSHDDLAQAADATAEVATVPPPVATPASVDTAADIDLGALGLDPESSLDDKLALYGFADVGFSIAHWARNPVFFPQDSRTFYVGNLNLYLSKSITPKARALAEVRFTFLPNGTRNADGSFVITTGDDYTDSQRKSEWGGIAIERAYLEYDVAPYMTVRVGRWLTPYGIWNIDHGSPVIIGIQRPYIIGEKYFPERQTGLDIFGSHHVSGVKLGYHLTASNGRGATEAVSDQDNEPAFGGRLEAETPWGVKVGASYYRGRYTGLPEMAGAPAETFLEAAYGVDAQLDRGGLHVQTEVIAQEVHYEAGQRVTAGGGFMPDGRSLGAYLLAGYRFNTLWNAMPFSEVSFHHPSDPEAEGGNDIQVGLNFRPNPSLVLKLTIARIALDEGQTFLAGQRFYVYGTQASWMF
jgi:hypothetical protein